MENVNKLDFNPKESTVMHIDINSCFATVEQQANNLLRGRPIAVAAYNSPRGCIVSPSIEAKKFGVKVGMRVQEGKALCPGLIVMEPDPQKYRNVHIALKNLLLQYTNNVVPKSIDEFVLNLEGTPAQKTGLHKTAKEIKTKIKQSVGDYITVSIGIGPNRFLAKTASNLRKPDGLEEINLQNFKEVYQKIELTDLTGIANNNAVRLNKHQIHTVLDFYNSTPQTLKGVFQSIVGYHWFLRLRGWEVDDVDFGRKSFGNSFALPQHTADLEKITPLLYKLVEKATLRMRKQGYTAQGVHVAILYSNGGYWHHGHKTSLPLSYFADIYKIAYKILKKSPYKYPVRTLAVSCFNLSKRDTVQTSLFDDLPKKERLAEAVDKIIEKWGGSVITPARILTAENKILDRISFGGVKELEDMVMN